MNCELLLNSSVLTKSETMKKVLLTKSQRFVETSLQPKEQQNGTTSQLVISTSKVMPTQVITNTYKERKDNQQIYEDIFKLLMLLPDKALQQRVIDAINGSNNNKSKDKATISQTCNKCSCGLKSEQRTVKIAKQDSATQTCSTDTIININQIGVQKKDVKNKSNNTPTATENISQAKTGKVAKKRGRKPNTCVPKVVKRSAAQLAMQDRDNKHLSPLPKKKKTEISKPAAPQSNEDTSTNQHRLSVDSNFLADVDCIDMCNMIESIINDDVKQTIVNMRAAEVIRADQMSHEGLLPIHDAILNSDLSSLKRQIYVWSKIRTQTNINDLLSADNEDCLELAVTSNCDPEIVKILLGAGVSANHIYEYSNTIVHMAVINDIALDSLRELLQHIDLKLLLLTNDDGYTALHIAVRNNQYKMAEIICNSIDERELGNALYQRTDDKSTESTADMKTVQAMDVKMFSKYYEQACDNLEQSKIKDINQTLKHKLLNAPEKRAGNCALYYAVEGELDHLCYFLLSHLCDPDAENLSGCSPKSFHYEFARVLRINLKISRIMDKVTNILKS